MRNYEYQLQLYDEDVYGFVPPQKLAELAIHYSMRASTEDGISPERLMAELGGVWMMLRQRSRQTRPVKAGELLAITVSNRILEGGIVVRRVGISDSLGPAAAVDMAIAAVNSHDRVIIRARDVEPLWDEPSERNAGHTISRIGRYHGDALVGARTIRWSDCDANGHMNAPHYTESVCELTGFLRDGPKLMRSLAIDYSVECRPGTELAMYGEREDGVWRLRAENNGGVAFTAECEYSSVG